MTIRSSRNFVDGNGDAVDPTSVKLSNHAGTAGITKFLDGAVIVADGAAFTEAAVGQYHYDWDPPARNTLYAIYTEIVYQGHTVHSMKLKRSQPHDETEPILEQLAQWWAAKLETITAAGGFFQDLESVRRPEDGFWSGVPTTDLSCELQLGLPQQLEAAGTLNQYAWRQTFIVNLFLAGQGGGSDVVDTRITRLAHDVHGLVAAEIAASTDGTYCAGLAEGLAVGPYTIEPHEAGQMTLLRVPILVDYTESVTDPTQQ